MKPRNQIKSVVEVPYQGTFGCVTRPALLCASNTDSQIEELSKIIIYEEYENEMSQLKEIDKIDVNDNYHTRIISACRPAISDTEYEALNKQCTNPVSLRNMTQGDYRRNTMIMLMHDGGENWETFSERNDLRLDDIKNFLISSYNVVRGVQHMHDHDFIHDDIKTSNLVYNKSKNVSNIIDFGLSGLKNSILNERRGGSNIPVQWWYAGAPERLFQYSNTFSESQVNFNKHLYSNDQYALYVNWFKNPRDNENKGFDYYYNHLSPDEIENTKYQVNGNIVEFLDLIKDANYEWFLENTLFCIDVYCLALSFLAVTHQFHQNWILRNALMRTDDDSQQISNLIRNIRQLAISATNVNPQRRLTPKQFAQGYEDCVLNNIKQPELTLDNDFKRRIFFVYPHNSFQTGTKAINRVTLGSRSWTRDSAIVSEYEDSLILDLVEFVQVFDKLKDNNIYHSIIQYYNQPSFLYFINIRDPQTRSQISKKLDYRSMLLNLIGSRYVACVCYTDDPLFQSSSRPDYMFPYIFVDSQNSSIYVDWYMKGKLSKICFSYSQNLASRAINDPNRLSVITEKELNKCIFNFNPIPRILFVVELVCLTLVEMYAQSTLVSRLVSIICEPTSQNPNALLFFERTFKQLISRVQKAASENGFQQACETRYILSLIRGGIATDSVRLISHMKLFNIKHHGIMHRKHKLIKDLQNEMKKALCEGSIPPQNGIDVLAYQFQGSKQTKHSTKEYREQKIKINNLLSDAFFRMDDDDVAFTHRGLAVTVNALILKDTSQRDNPLRRIIDANFTEDVVGRINKTASNNRSIIKVYSQLQVNAMILMPDNFKGELQGLINYLHDDTKNTIYVIFEIPDKNDGYNRFLVHGFKLRRISKEFKTMELVVLVPEPCMFKVLEPVTWRFMHELRTGLSQKLNYIVNFIKAENYLLSKTIYSKGRIYVSLYESLIQTELIANQQKQNKKAHFKNQNEPSINQVIDPKSIERWSMCQYEYIFQQMFDD